MKELSGFPYFEIQFTKEGKVFDQNEVDALYDALNKNDISDLLLISHGWNNDLDDARQLYKNLVFTIAQENASSASKHTFAVAAILWPSKKFAEKDLIAGGAAGISTPQQSTELAALTSQ